MSGETVESARVFWSMVIGFLALLVGVITAGDASFDSVIDHPDFLVIARLIVGAALIVLGLALILIPLAGIQP